MAQFSLQVTLEINLVLERLIMFLSKTLVTVWWERTSDLFQRRQYSSEAVCTSNQNKYPCNDLLHAASSASLFHVLTSVNVHKSAPTPSNSVLVCLPSREKSEREVKKPKTYQHIPQVFTGKHCSHINEVQNGVQSLLSTE